MSTVWDEPVVVGDHLIFTPHQAHQFLRTFEAGAPRSKRLAADGALMAAMDGRQCPEDAKRIFLEAVRLVQS